jgi:hypothetical protein
LKKFRATRTSSSSKEKFRVSSSSTSKGIFFESSLDTQNETICL